MHIISTKARVVCATIAFITSATLLAATVFGITSPDLGLQLAMAHAMA